MIVMTPEQRRDLMRAQYPTGDLGDLCRQLDITLTSLQAAASRLGIRRARECLPQARWTPAMDAIVTAEYPRADVEALAAKLGVTLKALRIRAGSLGVRRWVKPGTGKPLPRCGCGKVLNRDSRTGRCKQCHARQLATTRPVARRCLCGAQIARRNVSGRCADCHQGHIRQQARKQTYAPMANNRPTDLSARAADFLARYAPVYRCDDKGAQNAKGSHWRYGSAILTDVEVIARAERKGWDPDAWKRLAA